MKKNIHRRKYIWRITYKERDKYKEKYIWRRTYKGGYIQRGTYSIYKERHIQKKTYTKNGIHKKDINTKKNRHRGRQTEVDKYREKQAWKKISAKENRHRGGYTLHMKSDILEREYIQKITYSGAY